MTVAGLVGCQVVAGIDDRTLVVDAGTDAHPFDAAPPPDTSMSIPDSGHDPGCRDNDPGARNDCGASGMQNCCAATLVPGGTFKRSYDGVMFTNAGFSASVSDFDLDVYEVTVGRFRDFVVAGMGEQSSPPKPGDGANPKIPGSGWDLTWNTKLVGPKQLRPSLHCSATYETWTEAPGVNERFPINCVTWYEAFAFCAWDGGRLPTEAEWNFASSGAGEQRAYPWSVPAMSTTIDHGHAVYDCLDDGHPGCTFTDIARVGSKEPTGTGRFGQSDLAGNMWEWVLDLSNDPYPTPCNDCAVLTAATTDRVIRGGSFSEIDTVLLSSNRAASNPTNRTNNIGIRCARAPSAPPPVDAGGGG